VRTIISVVVPTTTLLLLTAVGMDLTAEDFARVRRQWPLVVVGLVAPLMLLPPIALALIWWFQAPPEIAAGILLVAACPVGGISNSYSYLARAAPALSITLTALSCAGAVATVPLVGAAFELALSRPLGLRAPGPMLAAQLVLFLGLPVAAGMLLRWRAEAFAVRYAAALQRAAYIGVGILLVLIILDAPQAFAVSFATGMPVAVLFVTASVVAGWLTAAAVTGDRRNRFTIAAEFGARNVGIATAIAVTVLGRVEFARFAATYALIEIPILLAAVALFRATEPRLPA
jgi:bile acid:Na+ symporter, BASS family